MKAIKIQPKFKNGRYENPWSTWTGLPNFISVAKWWFTPQDHSKDKLSEHLKVVNPQFFECPDPGITATWLGHSSVLLQIDGAVVLTDPIFSERCSPIYFAGPKRLLKPPCSVNNLPQIDAVVISHNHYDHLDKQTVSDLLNQQYGPRLQWFVSMGLKGWFSDMGCNHVIEMNWWDEHSMFIPSKIKMVCLPCQHWSGRAGYLDKNTSLWCSWAVIGPSCRFYFVGDTGYCPEFKNIGNLYGPFDLAAIPIGCYEPRSFMQNQHIKPAEAVKIHNDVKATFSLGIHWGTYDMGSAEPFEEPKLQIAEEVAKAGLKPEIFFTLNHGESWPQLCRLDNKRENIDK
jgi:N-acyl-phosphatidylethanolamine-hydrolysing phospholipase D